MSWSRRTAPGRSMADPERRASEAEVVSRIAIVRRLAAEHGADGALLRTRRNFAWLTVGGANHVAIGSEEGAAPILVDRAAATVLAPVNEADRLVDDELAGVPVDLQRIPWHDPDAVDQAIWARGLRSVVGDAALEISLAPIRARLTDVEAARMAWMGERLTAAMDELLARLEPGTTELEVVGELLLRLTSAGVRVPVLLAAADDRIERYRHPLPTAAAARRRLMLIAVVERWGLHVALTRIRELEPPPAGLAQRLQAVATVQEAMHAATRPGATLGAVVGAARRAYAEVGFADEWRLHHQGGLLGYRPRELIATPEDTTVLTPGMAVAWNPSITGAKLEASLLVTDSSTGMHRALTGPEPVHAI